MEEHTVTGIVDDTEDSDVSLLIVNDADENTGGGSSNDGANPRIPNAAISDGTTAPASPALDMGVEATCPVSEAATQEAVVVTSNDSSCPRRRRRLRRHHRSGSSRRRHRLCRFKRKESNYVSATCHMIVIVLVCIAIMESWWFYIQGGRCSDAELHTVNYLGIKTFFYQGSGSTFMNRNAYFYGNSLHDVLLDCVTSDIVFVIRVIIALCFFVIFISLNACLMDTFGPTHVICRAIRFTASLSILSACACVVITGLCYLVSEQLSNYYSKTRLHHTGKVLVQFSIGFYMITSAGAVSIVGVACTLMRRVRGTSNRRRGGVSTDRRHVESDIERLAEVASVARPPAGRTPPPYRR